MTLLLHKVFGSLWGFKRVPTGLNALWQEHCLLTNTVGVLCRIAGAYLENWNYELLKVFLTSYPNLFKPFTDVKIVSGDLTFWSDTIPGDPSCRINTRCTQATWGDLLWLLCIHRVGAKLMSSRACFHGGFSPGMIWSPGDWDSEQVEVNPCTWASLSAWGDTRRLSTHSPLPAVVVGLVKNNGKKPGPPWPCCLPAPPCLAPWYPLGSLNVPRLWRTGKALCCGCCHLILTTF
jgi:hypothetical protein